MPDTGSCPAALLKEVGTSVAFAQDLGERVLVERSKWDRRGLLHAASIIFTNMGKPPNGRLFSNPLIWGDIPKVARNVRGLADQNPATQGRNRILGRNSGPDV